MRMWQTHKRTTNRTYNERKYDEVQYSVTITYKNVQYNTHYHKKLQITSANCSGKVGYTITEECCRPMQTTIHWLGEVA